MTTTIHNITPQEALQRVIEHREIFHDEMLHIMRLIMRGEMSPPPTRNQLDLGCICIWDCIVSIRFIISCIIDIIVCICFCIIS